ncbi:histidinol-phosphate transaminase [Variovorax sp. WS11]|uniref:histidinol-phosphate transaminase n=1 Tax=Variovorax sp. WS11 TaxID=1105204 RepID=UPI000D0CB9E8|nr:histidinol-phosphate transaminase [Variovorax sp. WS11]NDZ11890.1 histidinol-phosphate transaminase [Variovorax sp. WS11]PSL80685.1 histidinol-phosphate transaminase [Variovorax sp. WS11]
MADDQTMFPQHIRALKPYVPGLPIEQVARRLKLPVTQIAKLASNENPLGASPLALRALAEQPIDPSRYPDADCTDLTHALAAHLDVPADWVVAAAGSESILGIVASMLLAPGRSAVYSQYSFQAFVNAVQRVGGSAQVVPSPGFTVDLEAVANAIGPDTSLVYIANPGNPTGAWLAPQALEAFLARVPSKVVVLLDEAYREYMPAERCGDSLAWLRRHPNLIVTRTFSKAYGLAGLRVGYGVAQPHLADVMRRLRAPFSVTQSAQLAGAAALADSEFLRRTAEANRQGLAQLGAALQRMGIEALPSSANFVLARVGDGADMAQRLQRRGLIVRPVANYGLPEWVRLSVGRNEENARLIDALETELQALTDSK